MPRTEEENQRIRAEQSRRIKDAALVVFSRKGLAATRIADIAVQADVSYGLVYHYFGSKEKIFAALVRDAMEGTASAARRALEMPGTPWQRIHWLFSEVLDGLHHRPEYIMVALQVMTDEGAPRELRDLVHKGGGTFRNVLRQLIIEGQAVGEVVQGDPDQLVAAAQAFASGLAVEAMFLDHDSFIRSLPDIDVILRLLKS